MGELVNLAQEQLGGTLGAPPDNEMEKLSEMLDSRSNFKRKHVKPHVHRKTSVYDGDHPYNQQLFTKVSSDGSAKSFRTPAPSASDIALTNKRIADIQGVYAKGSAKPGPLMPRRKHSKPR
jgi:hypothetical protein